MVSKTRNQLDMIRDCGIASTGIRVLTDPARAEYVTGTDFQDAALQAVCHVGLSSPWVSRLFGSYAVPGMLGMAVGCVKFF